MAAIILMFSTSGLWARDLYLFDSPKKEAQFSHLLQSLRCLVCQNQDLSDSNASLAQDLKQEIYLRITRGESDEMILKFLTERYGDFILFNPKFTPLTYALWGGPILFLLIGVGLLGRFYHCNNQVKG